VLDPEQMTPAERRFWSKVDVQRHPDGSLDFEKCWEWTGYRTRPSRRHKTHPGYGGFRLLSDQEAARLSAELGEVVRARVRAHRHAWELWHGEKMPPELDAAHVTCDHPPCCNPTHIGPQAHDDNWRWFMQRYGSPNGKAAAR
jgi:hypothetical protein